MAGQLGALVCGCSWPAVQFRFLSREEGTKAGCVCITVPEAQAQLM